MGISKLHKESGACPNPTVWWPASSPYVVSVGGTELQDGWAWNPSSNDAFTSTGAFNPAYWAWTGGGHRDQHVRGVTVVGEASARMKKACPPRLPA